MTSAEVIGRTRQVFRCTVGSTVYGTGVTDQDDRDLMGIAVEPETDVIGLGTFTHWTWRTQPEGVRSGPGDTDLVVYGLRRWCELAIKGNPSVLMPLFVPDSEVEVCDVDVRLLRGLLVARSCAAPFLGYATQQRERLQGIRGGRHTNRPELVERYGFDTKYAYHMLRLGLQGVELLQTGWITVPFPTHVRDFLVAVRTGQVPLDECLSLAETNEQELIRLRDDSTLPDRPNLPMINQFLVGTYQARWRMER